MSGSQFLIGLEEMKKLQSKKQNPKYDNILKYRELFKEFKLNQREIKEIKNHFDEMAGLLVNMWLKRKESIANKKLCHPNQKSKLEN